MLAKKIVIEEELIMKNLQKGFTLIELMIVVAIIAILAAVAAPRFGAQIQRSRDAKGLQVIGSWRAAINLAYADDLVYATTFGALTNNVDNGTQQATLTTSAAVATASDNVRMVQVGTATGTGRTDNVIDFSIVGSITNSSIVIAAANGNDTRDEAWGDK
jgi:type IV pilus assembly protein PilA